MDHEGTTFRFVDLFAGLGDFHKALEGLGGRAVFAAVGDQAVPTWTMDGLVEISAVGVTKAVALTRFAADLGIVADEVIAFGDMPNDIPMLTWAGRGCAVANAHPSVIACADAVVPTNDEDGVAETLARIFGL